MLSLASFIKGKTPKYNEVMVEGYAYHKFKNIIEYLDGYIRFTAIGKTKTHLRYLGYQEVDYKDEFKRLISKTTKVPYDIAKNNIYLVDFIFQYGDEENVRRYSFYLPYIEKGNILTLSGNNFLAMPVLSDKVISVGENVIFINVLTAKYNFYRAFYSVKVNDRITRVPIIHTELYKNQSKKLEDTTKALSTVMHYLLGNFGFSKATELLLGFTPKVVYDAEPKKGQVVISSVGVEPSTYILNEEYKQTRIKFVIPEDKFNEDVLFTLGNIFYIIDNFPDSISITDMDNTFVWKRLLGEIIHSGNHQVSYIMEKMSAHFNDINSNFDPIIINKLKDIRVDACNLIHLLMIIFKNYNSWIMGYTQRSLYHNKTYEIESYIMSKINYRVTKAYLDICKEELRVDGQQLDSKTVSKIIDKYFVPKAIFGIKKERLYLSSIEYCGDHLYPKNTAMVVVQESNPINTTTASFSTADKRKINASMATVGNILGLPKKNPTPIVRLNPYVNVDPISGTVLPPIGLEDIIQQTEELLMNNVKNSDLETDADLLVDGDEAEITEIILDEETELEEDESVVENIEID